METRKRVVIVLFNAEEYKQISERAVHIGSKISPYLRTLALSDSGKSKRWVQAENDYYDKELPPEEYDDD